MPRNSRPTIAVGLYCGRCKTKQIIWRLAGRLRGRNHIKHLYCYRCNRRTAHLPTSEE